MRRLSIIRNAERTVLASGIVAALLSGGVAHAADAEPGPAGTAPISNSASGPSISADGRYVAFTSLARDLVTGDTNLERTTCSCATGRPASSPGSASTPRAPRPTTRVGIRRSPPTAATSRSSPSRRTWYPVTPTATATFSPDLRPVRPPGSASAGGEQSDGESFHPSISAEGRFVAFDSPASNLVFGDTNDIHDVFVRDWQTGETTRVSVDSNGRQGDDVSQLPSISADGRYVAFSSGAKTLSLFPDNNHSDDVFVHDRLTGYTDRISVGPDGNEGNSASRTAPSRPTAATSRSSPPRRIWWPATPAVRTIPTSSCTTGSPDDDAGEPRPQ